mmetsp:Transcript_10056/g.12070  ORF Transcript_10056/g.12070 Transcript_10056/m.12070 type:complete len:236 (+) Transcript_10056:285-992(+)
MAESLENLFPENSQLQFAKPITDAAVDTEAERQVIARLFAINDDFVWILVPEPLVAITRDIPHRDLVALFDRLAVHLDIFKRRPAHEGERRLPANNFRHHVRNQVVIGFQFRILFRKLVQAINRRGHRITGCIIATNDEQDDIAEQFHRRHILGFLTMGEQTDQIVSNRLTLLFLVQFHESREAFHQLGAPLLFSAWADIGIVAIGRNVRPTGQFAAILERKVKQSGQHHCCQLN